MARGVSRVALLLQCLLLALAGFLPTRTGFFSTAAARPRVRAPSRFAQVQGVWAAAAAAAAAGVLQPAEAILARDKGEWYIPSLFSSASGSTQATGKGEGRPQPARAPPAPAPAHLSVAAGSAEEVLAWELRALGMVPGPGAPLFATFCSIDLWSFAWNWVHHARRSGVGAFVVLALDEAMAERCRGEGIPALNIAKLWRVAGCKGGKDGWKGGCKGGKGGKGEGGEGRGLYGRPGERPPPPPAHKDDDWEDDLFQAFTKASMPHHLDEDIGGALLELSRALKPQLLPLPPPGDRPEGSLLPHTGGAGEGEGMAAPAALQQSRLQLHDAQGFTCHLPFGGEVDFFPTYLDEGAARQLHEEVLGCATFKRAKFQFGGGKEGLSPRQTCWFGERDHRVQDRLPDSDVLPAHPLPPLMAHVMARLSDALGVRFNACVAGLYCDGSSSCGYHADKELGLGPQPVIASLSLGVSRTFVLVPAHLRKHCGRNPNTPTTVAYRLTHRSMLVMRGRCQETYVHGVPQEPNAGLGARLNLTFRAYDYDASEKPS